MYNLHFTLLRQPFQPRGQLADHIAFMRSHCIKVDVRLAKFYPVLGKFLGFVNHFRRVQQCLGRDATDVETYTADIGETLDQHHFFAKVSSAERSGVTAWARA